MREFDPDVGYRVFVRSICGLAAGVCSLLLAFIWFQSGIADFYHPASAGSLDFRLIGGIVAGLFWCVASLVSGRFVWFVISRRPGIDLGIFASLVVLALALYLVRQSYYLPDDDLHSGVTKFGTSTSRDDPLPLTQRFASMHRDCRLGSYHLIVIVHDKSKESNREFIAKHLLNYSEHVAVASYMQLRVDVKELSARNNMAFVDRFDWPKATRGVLAIAYDIEGKELGRIRIDPEASEAADTAHEFLERHVPAQQDAEAKWNKVFQQAKEQNKLVWVCIGQRYCGPCFMLSRWIDDHREILERDFIFLKIDDVRDLNGQAIAERLTKGRSVGVPFHAIFDANEKTVTDSYGPLGNIGFMSGLEGKRHFKTMLDEACSNITPQEIQALLDSLQD